MKRQILIILACTCLLSCSQPEDCCSIEFCTSIKNDEICEQAGKTFDLNQEVWYLFKCDKTVKPERVIYSFYKFHKYENQRIEVLNMVHQIDQINYYSPIKVEEPGIYIIEYTDENGEILASEQVTFEKD